MRPYFNPRSPRGERQLPLLAVLLLICYFNPRSPRGERPISNAFHFYFRNHFNPRSPRGERPRVICYTQYIICYFNPRSPRGERREYMTHKHELLYFNPRSPRGERHYFLGIHLSILPISIHALREESDIEFLENMTDTINISIHALREESDQQSRPAIIFYSYFNPRSPRGERRNHTLAFFGAVIFQSTLSARRATLQLMDLSNIIRYFNPRSPRGERHF